jgi:hypothetical protein
VRFCGAGRVWKLLEAKEIDRKGREQKVESENQKGAKQDRRKELEQEGGGSFGGSGGKSFNIVSCDYDSVNTRISD